MLGSISCGKSPSIFYTKSFTPCRCIVGIRARNFNKPKQFCNNSIESHSGDASVSWLKQDMQCLRNVGTWASTSQHNSTHLSVDWCVRYQFPIDFDCCCVSVEARIGQLLIIERLFNCQPWLSFWGSSMSFSNPTLVGHEPCWPDWPCWPHWQNWFCWPHWPHWSHRAHLPCRP